MKPSEYIKKGWTTTQNARRADGMAVGPLSKDAVCWCAFGAISASDLPPLKETDYIQKLSEKCMGDIMHFDDEGGPRPTDRPRAANGSGGKGDGAMKPSEYIKKGWTRDASARTADGKPAFAGNPEAVCWCALGAIAAAITDPEARREYRYRLTAKLPPHAFEWGAIAHFNDDIIQNPLTDLVPLMEAVEKEMGL